MSLALDYRPHTLSEIAGQKHIAIVLATALRRTLAGEIRLPSALAFTGPRGTGKTSTARIVASYLNCTDTSIDKPCTKCPSCLSIINGTSQDVIEIDAASHGLVDDMRDLARLTRLTHPGLWRVIIIDEIHAASKEAFSALLKQLEEPPANVLYILVTTEENAIPANIKSRCLRLVFTSLSEDDILARLEFVCIAESFTYEQRALEYISRRARGGLRDAMMLLEHLAILNDITVARATVLWPDDLEVFATLFIDSSSKGLVEIGISSIRSTFLVNRDVTVMIDAIIRHISDSMILAQHERIRPAARLRQMAIIMKMCWDVRINAKTSNLTDPILIEALWHMASSDSTAPSSDRVSPIKEPWQLEVIKSVEIAAASDLDAILSGT